MSNIIKRQIEDLLMSDMLPVEKPHYFTNSYFYNYVLEKRFEINPYNPSAPINKPLEYLTSKKDTFRKLNIINPIGMIQTLRFMKTFQHDLLATIDDVESFSIRKPTYNNDLFYLKTEGDIIYYKNKKRQFLISLESSGIYFKHLTFKRLDKYINSFKYQNQIENYKYQSTLDIQDFFGSIYTHSYKWLLSRNFTESKKISENKEHTIFPTIDKHLQKINGGKTRGILVGPEFSRICAELLMVNLDNIVMNKLDLKPYVDYEISRFVDDYFIFYNNPFHFTEIKKVLSDLLNDYHFLFKENKETTLLRENNFSDWKEDVKQSIKLLEQVIEGTISLNVVINSIKRNSAIHGEKLITSYLLSSIVSIVEKAYKNNECSVKKRNLEVINYDNLLGNIYIESEEKVPNKHSEFNQRQKSSIIRIVFLLLSLHLNYMNSDKVIRILDLIIKQSINQGYKESNEVLEQISIMIDVYSERILEGYTVDWINLYLFLSNHNIDLKPNILDIMTSKILGEKFDLLAIPGLLMISENYNYKQISIKKRVNKYIRDELKKMNLDGLQNEQSCWIIYIFNNCPYLSRAINKEINKLIVKKIEKSKSDKNKSEIKFVFEFLKNKETNFIDWNIRDKYREEYYYYTRDRTVFNPKNYDGDNDY